MGDTKLGGKGCWSSEELGEGIKCSKFNSLCKIVVEVVVFIVIIVIVIVAIQSSLCSLPLHEAIAGSQSKVRTRIVTSEPAHEGTLTSDFKPPDCKK